MKAVPPPSIKDKRMLTYNEAHEYTRRVPTYLTEKQRARDSKIVKQIVTACDEENDLQKVLCIFFSKCKLLSNPAYWEVLRTVWVAAGSTDNAQRFRPYFLSNRGARSWFMTPEDTEVFNTLEYPIRLYRAYDNEDDEGISWTRDKEWCEDYAKSRGRKIKSRLFDKDEIYAYISRRGEEEFIIL